jgi:hypothetical protein
LAFAAAAVVPATLALSQDVDERTIQRGRDIFKNKGSCQYCHGWDGGGDIGYGGVAANLRETPLDRAGLIETISCGRPGTAMPFHDRRAWSEDLPCYGMTEAEAEFDESYPHPPQPVSMLHPREIEAVTDFILAVYVGQGAPTYEECVAFWGEDTRQCESYRQAEGEVGAEAPAPAN